MDVSQSTNILTLDQLVNRLIVPSRFCRNSEVFASELPKNLEEMILMYNDMLNILLISKRLRIVR